VAAKQQRAPQRTCIACRETTDKRGLIRIVRSPEQRVMVDESGKAKGRGAYLHAARECWEKALKGGTMSNALKLTPSESDLAGLSRFATTLPGEETAQR
jgi:uncharacterized protein